MSNIPIKSSDNVFPFKRVNKYVMSNPTVFPVGSEKIYRLGDIGDNGPGVNHLVKLKIGRSENNQVCVVGESQSTVVELTTVANFYVSEQRGQMLIPELNAMVKFFPNGIVVHHSDRKAALIAEEMVRVYWRQLNSVVDKKCLRDAVQEAAISARPDK